METRKGFLFIIKKVNKARRARHCACARGKMHKKWPPSFIYFVISPTPCCVCFLTLQDQLHTMKGQIAFNFCKKTREKTRKIVFFRLFHHATTTKMAAATGGCGGFPALKNPKVQLVYVVTFVFLL